MESLAPASEEVVLDAEFSDAALMDEDDAMTDAGSYREDDGIGNYDSFQRT